MRHRLIDKILSLRQVEYGYVLKYLIPVMEYIECAWLDMEGSVGYHITSVPCIIAQWILIKKRGSLVSIV